MADIRPTITSRGIGVGVFITEQKLDTMGGPHSEATSNFVEDIVNREGYCKTRTFVPDVPSRNPHGVYWQFGGSCKDITRWYSATYNPGTHRAIVHIGQEKLDSMGGPHSEATRAFVEEIVKREKCGVLLTFVPEAPRRSRYGGFWSFPGSCTN